MNASELIAPVGAALVSVAASVVSAAAAVGADSDAPHAAGGGGGGGVSAVGAAIAAVGGAVANAAGAAAGVAAGAGAGGKAEMTYAVSELFSPPHDSGSANKLTYSWIIAILLASIASVISNLGTNLQKMQHNANEEERRRALDDPQYQEPNYACQPRWGVGMGFIILGALGDFAALSFGPQSLVTPLGSLTLVSQAIFAPLLLGESMGIARVTGIITIIIGSILAVMFAPHTDTDYSNEELFDFFLKAPFVVYSVLVVVGCASFLWFVNYIEKLERQLKLGGRAGVVGTDSPTAIGDDVPTNASDAELAIVAGIQYNRWKSWHRFVYPCVSGVVGAQSVLFAKCFVELLVNTMQGRGRACYTYYETYFIFSGMLGSIILQTRWLNDGLARYDASYVVPVFQAFWICMSVISGMVFYHEYQEMSRMQLAMFAVGVTVTVVGVYIISDHHPVSGIDDDAETDGSNVVRGDDGSGGAGAGDRDRDGLMAGSHANRHRNTNAHTHGGSGGGGAHTLLGADSAGSHNSRRRDSHHSRDGRDARDSAADLSPEIQAVSAVARVIRGDSTSGGGGGGAGGHAHGGVATSMDASAAAIDADGGGGVGGGDGAVTAPTAESIAIDIVRPNRSAANNSVAIPAAATAAAAAAAAVDADFVMLQSTTAS